jgi:hypothetical protein
MGDAATESHYETSDVNTSTYTFINWEIRRIQNLKIYTWPSAWQLLVYFGGAIGQKYCQFSNSVSTSSIMWDNYVWWCENIEEVTVVAYCSWRTEETRHTEDNPCSGHIQTTYNPLPLCEAAHVVFSSVTFMNHYIRVKIKCRYIWNKNVYKCFGISQHGVLY